MLFTLCVEHQITVLTNAFPNSFFTVFLYTYIINVTIEAQYPVLYVNKPKKKGASSAQARSWASKY
jgi:hypothetical protein